ncbi:hypothetical protein TNCV_4074031 [Trichonephila clavipes]|uniref:Uncharacterized protein n=1 Tax=Trichonephila clavipes TaxID=2585209 RepID=A0A8X7BG58_TRICX|nr:hypothetical protein TNCV_4074031 [Trichonephila clavipes]
MFDGLVAFAVGRWRSDYGARRVQFMSWPGSPMKEGRFVLGTFRSERMRVLYRSRQNDRLHVMLVLVHIDITPPHNFMHGETSFHMSKTVKIGIENPRA